MAIEAELLESAASVTGTLGLWGDQPYALDAKLRQLPVHLILPDSADGRALEALATGTSTIAGDLGENWSPVSIETELNAVELTWEVTL